MSIAILLLAGCGPTIRPDFNSPEPAARNAAIVQAAARRDAAAIPSLVRLLASDDPGTRLLAITALERLTGRTNGFAAGAPESERTEAIERWNAELVSAPRPPASAPVDRHP
jgi:HEAT repeat protein